MLSVWCAFRAEGRRRWASWLAIAALVALVGGTVLTGAAAARRTDAAFPDYLARYGYDAEVYATAPTTPPSVARLPYVRDLLETSFYINANGSTGGQLIPANDFTVLVLPRHATSDLVKLSSGRLPVTADEADVGYSMQQQFHLHLGSTVVVPFYALSQRHEVFASSGTPTPHGVTARFRVVGVAAGIADFPSTTPSYSVYVGRAFADSVGRRSVSGSLGFVRLSRGAGDLGRLNYDTNHTTVGGGFVGSQALDDQTSAVETSIHPQAVGWWLFALLAALAGLALVGQALSRQSLEERESYPSLSAVGYRPVQLFGIGMVRAAVVGLLGAAGALALAVVLSPLTPVGEPQVAEIRRGFVVDPVVFGLGGAAVVVAVLLLGAIPAWRAGQVRRLQGRADRQVGHGASRVVGALSRTGAGPSVLVGVRHALERGRGRSSVPVASALVGTAAAIVALVAACVFGQSLSTLLATPRLYGQDFQLVLSGFSGPTATSIAARLDTQPTVSSVTAAVLGKYVTVDGVSVSSTIAIPLKGPMVFSVVDGRDPRGPTELALGSQTMHDAGLHVGSSAAVTLIAPSGATERGRFRVVGSLSFPPSISQGGGLGVGAVVTLPGALGLVCPGRQPACESAVRRKIYSPSFTNWGMAVRVAPDAAGRAVVAALTRRYPAFVQELAVPTNLVNFGQAVNFPALLGITLALFGAATLAHLLLVSASRRRREFALLKVLGFVQRQVRGTVSWQATTVAVVGIAFGVPIGLAIGNVAWQAFASNLGVVPLTVVPVGLVVLVGAGALLVGNLLALVPATVAARARPAAALREE